MSLLSLLMRCLLCAALVLNGASAAAASVGMLETAHASGATEDANGNPHATDCARHPVAPTTGGASSVPDPSPDPDCCKAANCTCACVHGCATVVSTSTPTPVIILHAQRLPAPPVGHPAPVLPHLIRPPIG
nr:CopL family metal-binding regulatory protein [Pseudoxanthomonas sp.]